MPPKSYYLVPIAWVAMPLVDWWVYGDPIHWVSRSDPTAPLHLYITTLMEPTAGFVAGCVLITPFVFRITILEGQY